MKTTAIQITQYLRPSGRPASVDVELPEDIAKKAQTLVLSCECINGSQVILYGRKKGSLEEEEQSEMAFNGPGEGNPTSVLIYLIERVAG